MVRIDYGVGPNNPSIERQKTHSINLHHTTLRPISRAVATARLITGASGLYNGHCPRVSVGPANGEQTAMAEREHVDELRPVDRLEAQIVVDNASDNLSSIPDLVQHEREVLA